MCPVAMLGAIVRLLLVCLCIALTLFMPNVLFGIAVWPIVWLIWQRLESWERLPTGVALQLAPFAIAAQVTLDELVPFLGDLTLVVVNAAIVGALLQPKLPPAQLVRKRNEAPGGASLVSKQR